jgi:hypothetical protein
MSRLGQESIPRLCALPDLGMPPLGGSASKCDIVWMMSEHEELARVDVTST